MKKLFTVLFVFAACAAFSQDDSIIVTGFGNSPEEAKKSAFITAIEQTVGVMVSSEVLLENGELIKDKLHSNSQGFIESYNIISSGKDGNTFVVTIKAKVAKNKIQTRLDEITHLNDARLSYEAVRCNPAYKNAMWCKGGDISLFNMNYGIHADSYALLRQYRGDITETQLYFRMTLREKAYFYEAADSNGNKLELKYVDMGSAGENAPGRTVTEDFIIVLDSRTPQYLKKFINNGLEIKVTGSNKVAAIKIPGAYIEGFVKYIEENAK